jgi:hypothetical protein
MVVAPLPGNLFCTNYLIFELNKFGFEYLLYIIQICKYSNDNTNQAFSTLWGLIRNSFEQIRALRHSGS